MLSARMRGTVCTINEIIRLKGDVCVCTHEHSQFFVCFAELSKSNIGTIVECVCGIIFCGRKCVCTTSSLYTLTHTHSCSTYVLVAY